MAANSHHPSSISLFHFSKPSSKEGCTIQTFSSSSTSSVQNSCSTNTPHICEGIQSPVINDSSKSPFPTLDTKKSMDVGGTNSMTSTVESLCSENMMLNLLEMLIILGASYKLQENHNSCTSLSVVSKSLTFTKGFLCLGHLCYTLK